MRQICYINVKLLHFIEKVFSALICYIQVKCLSCIKTVTCHRKCLPRVKMVVSHFSSVRQTCYILSDKLIEFVTFNKI